MDGARLPTTGENAHFCYEWPLVQGRCDVLILAAFRPELAPLQPVLGETMTGPVGRARVAARIAGVGLSASAVGAALVLGELEPGLAVMMGTCGAYPGSGLAVGDVVVARRVRLVDATVAQGLSEFPAPMSIAVDADTSLAEALTSATGARPVDVATTLAITVDASTAAHIALASGAHVEHLEAHAIATACGARRVPFGAVLGVANLVGAGAREQWRAHHQAASQSAADVVLGWLRSERLR